MVIELKRDLQYLAYLAKHKFFVLVAGCRMGVTPASLWRLLKHDWTKFLPSEWFPYAKYFYGEYTEEDEAKRVFENATRLHYKRNDHHWQHWVLIDDEHDMVTMIPLEIPHGALLEMVADWMGAGRTIHGRWEVMEWYEQYKHEMVMHPKTQALLEKILAEMCPTA